ncbi:MAG TPA: hypothetical protein VH481_06450 [Nitrososphaeraceae archaeon]
MTSLAHAVPLIPASTQENIGSSDKDLSKFKFGVPGYRSSSPANFTHIFQANFGITNLTNNKSAMATMPIDVAFQSNKTVVLRIVDPNTQFLIWPAVDVVKKYGYHLDQVILTSSPNTTEDSQIKYVILSKQ